MTANILKVLILICEHQEEAASRIEAVQKKYSYYPHTPTLAKEHDAEEHSNTLQIIGSTEHRQMIESILAAHMHQHDK